MAERESLLILDPARDILTVGGERVGKFVLSDVVWLTHSVSADGATIAWFPTRPTSRKIEQSQPVQFVTANREEGLVSMSSWPAVAVAVSPGAKWIGTANSIRNGFAIKVLRRIDGLELDLSHLVTEASNRDVDRLRFSGDARYLAVASRTHICILDIERQAIAFEAAGAYPVMSPVGAQLAYVGPDHHVMIRDLLSGAQEQIELDGHAIFVCGWTPDGRFLLVGALRSFGLGTNLVVIDNMSRKFATVIELPSETFDFYFWIRRSLADDMRRRPSTTQ